MDSPLSDIAAESLTPQQIVQELDKHIVGQQAAKRAVAIALRNRWRRMQIPEPMRHEITPKNILMIGHGWSMPPSSRLKPPSSPKSAMSDVTWSPSSRTSRTSRSR
jgi:hypothetical protein